MIDTTQAAPLATVTVQNGWQLAAYIAGILVPILAAYLKKPPEFGRRNRN